MNQTGTSKKKSWFLNLLLFCLGASCPIGESMNQYIPNASRAFTIVGALVCMVALMLQITQKHSVDSKPCRRFLTSFLIVIIMITMFRLVLNGESVEASYFEVPIFCVIALAIISLAGRYENTVKYFYIGFILMFFALVPMSQSGNYYNNETRNMGTYANPNQYAIDVMIAIALIFCLINNAKKSCAKTIYLASLLFCVYLVYTTGTRSVLVGIVFAMAVYLHYFTDMRKRIKLLIIIPAAAIAVAVAFGESNMMQRLLGGTYESSSISDNIRLSIWGTYLRNVDKFWMFGMSEKLMYTISRHSPHNSYLGIFVRYGIFALILYLQMNIMIAKLLLRNCFNNRLFKLSPERLAVSLVFLSFLVVQFFMETFSSRTYWVIVGLTFSCINRSSKQVDG